MNNINNETAQRAAKQHYILNGPPPDTFSSRMPAFYGTRLEAGKQGIRSCGHTKKICMICRRKYLAWDNRKQCICGGHLYMMNDYYYPGVKDGDKPGTDQKMGYEAEEL